MENLLSVQGVSRNYGELKALSDVNLELPRNQILGLLGLNGAGKSTLLRLVCGVLAPHEGQIHVAGNNVVEDAVTARSHIGFMPEQAPIYPGLTVREALRFKACLHGIRDNISEFIAAACELCGLTGYEDKLCGQLSHGYRKRMGIAQAVIHRPRLLVLDEPSSGLDPMQIKDMRNLVRAMAEDCAIIFSSHILAEVQALCDRVVVLHRGRILLDQKLDKQPGCGYTVVFANPPPAKQLGVMLDATVTSSSGNRFHIVPHDADAERCRLLLLQQSIEKSWGLQELLPQHTELEQTFLSAVQDADYENT